MSASGMSASAAPALAAARQNRLRAAWRFLRAEPLAHFMLLGGVLFALSSISTPAADPSRVIEITPALHAEMADLFRGRFHREPTPAEVQPLIDQWVRTEVLYREALAAGLDKGDQGLRDRLISKMNAIVLQQAKPGDPTEDQARAWFMAHRGQFDTPPEVDFIGVPFTGPDAEAKARATLALIQTGQEPPEVRLRARVYAGRRQDSIDPAFGPGFMAQLTALKRETWSLAHGRDAWFILRVDGLRDAKPASYEQYHDISVEGWRNDAAHAQANQAMGALTAHYIIRDTGAPR